jgi:hypothetical protein
VVRKEEEALAELHLHLLLLLINRNPNLQSLLDALCTALAEQAEKRRLNLQLAASKAEEALAERHPLNQILLLKPRLQRQVVATVLGKPNHQDYAKRQRKRGLMPMLQRPLQIQNKNLRLLSKQISNSKSPTKKQIIYARG